jgi:hypothetical protein
MADLSPWKRQIEEALTYGHRGHDLKDLEEMVEDGTLQAWCQPGSILLTLIREYPNQKQFNIFLGAGDLATLEPMFLEACEWGKMQGCTVAVLAGRPGWQRTFLTRQGWSVRPTILMEKQL